MVEGSKRMTRIIKTIELEGQQAVALFDTGAPLYLCSLKFGAQRLI